MFEIFMGASVPLAAGHESREKEAKTEHKLDVKGNRDEIERTTKTWSGNLCFHILISR